MDKERPAFIRAVSFLGAFCAARMGGCLGMAAAGAVLAYLSRGAPSPDAGFFQAAAAFMLAAGMGSAAAGAAYRRFHA